ncbi:MAG: hypothetical protein AB1403_13380 [Candidatus Riflebacteria bacterium]
MKKIKLLLPFIALSFPVIAMAIDKPGSGRISDLDGTAIDLLVGAPGGVVEPLDKRRTQPDKNAVIDMAQFLDYDYSSEENCEADLSWQDAEDPQPEQPLPDESESISDMIDEIEDFENQQSESSEPEIDSNITDYVETEFKL